MTFPRVARSSLLLLSLSAVLLACSSPSSPTPSSEGLDSAPSPAAAAQGAAGDGGEATPSTAPPKLGLEDSVRVCSRPRGANPFSANPAEYRCDAQAPASKSPVPDTAAGLRGSDIFTALRTQFPEAREEKVFIKQVEPGDDPKASGSSMSVGDDTNEWYDNWVSWDGTTAVVYLEVQGPTP